MEGSSSQEYLSAIGRREMACVEQLAQLPYSSLTLCGPGTYQPTRTKKLQAIQQYLDVLSAITPSEEAVKRPCLWHGDLHADNIFVDPNDPTRITGVLDWQSIEIAPLFVQVQQPHFLDYNGPQMKGLERPVLPANVAELPPDQQRHARQLWTLQSLSALYRHWLHVHHPEASQAFEAQDTVHYNLLLFARSLLVDGEATYMGQILELVDNHPELFDPNPPVFTANERAEIESDVEASLRGMQVMSAIQDALGGDLMPERGVVRPDQYHQAKDALKQMKEQVIEQFAHTDEERATWEKVWPFDD